MNSGFREIRIPRSCQSRLVLWDSIATYYSIMKSKMMLLYGITSSGCRMHNVHIEQPQCIAVQYYWTRPLVQDLPKRVWTTITISDTRHQMFLQAQAMCFKLEFSEPWRRLCVEVFRLDLDIGKGDTLMILLSMYWYLRERILMDYI